MSHEERTEVRLAIADRGRWRGEVIAYRKDGVSVWVELITVALRGSRGEITGYLGIHRDVSERRRATQELRASNGRVETILESITDAFVAVDQDWRYTYINDRALSSMHDRKRTALAREDVLGQSMWEMFPAADRHRDRPPVPPGDARAPCGHLRDPLRLHRRVDRGARLPLGLRIGDLLPGSQRAPTRRGGVARGKEQRVAADRRLRISAKPNAAASRGIYMTGRSKA
jgi:PAS domain-containing protein